MRPDTYENESKGQIKKDGKVLWVNVAFILGTPILAAVLAIWHIYLGRFTFAHATGFFVTWWLTGLGITMGYHRLFSHRSYSAKPWLQGVLAFCGGGSIENSVITWSAAHRYHHRDVDTAGDPYNAKRGFLYSHCLWLLREGPRHKDLSNVDDLWANPILVFQHRHYLKSVVLFNIGIPVLMGLVTGDVMGMLLWSGLVRLVVVHHATFTINSLAHIVGTQPYSSANTARDSWLISLVSYGEGYHNYHHAFQTDYRNGPRWFNYDPGKWLIWVCERFGSAYNVRRMPDELIVRKRFDEQKRLFQTRVEEVEFGLKERIDSLDERWSHWREELNSRFHEANELMEREVKRLKEARRAWAAATGKRRAELRREFRLAKLALKKTVVEWELQLELAFDSFHANLHQVPVRVRR
jgi:stearoyl-CoA desaturase (delta-9 desaturase)